MSSSFSPSTFLLAFAAPLLITLFWVMTSTSPPTPSVSKASNAFTTFLSTVANAIPNLSTSVPSASDIKGKRIVLLIAHPDDEAMFFGPTLTQLANPELGNHLKVLCLSTGNAEKLGAIRQEELHASALHLGIRRQSDIFILDDPNRFPDSMTKTWSATDIATLLAEAFAPDLAKSASVVANGKSRKEADTAPKATIDVLITFDTHGVSGHPNHISLSHGAELFLRLLMRDKSGWRSPVTLYHLHSINILRKYIFIVDGPITLLSGAIKNMVSGLGGKKVASASRGRAPGRDAPSPGGTNVADLDDKKRLLFIANPQDYWTIRGAMINCHKSQMIWFRWGWISLGRYMVVNELVRGRF